MKTIKFYLLALTVLITVGCTKDSEVENYQTKITSFEEKFTDNTDGTVLNTTGWINYAQAGTKKFTEEVYSGNGYAEFTSFGSGQAVNTAWLISPKIDMNLFEGEKLIFTVAHAFLTSPENTIELMVSTDFDGTVGNISQASWLNIAVKTPTPFNDFYENVSSGEVDLSKFTGNLYFAFKVKGSGTNTALDATFQIDNIKMYHN